jgi:hypothetical protein
MTDDERQDHEAKADELERELDEMQEHTDKLGGEIEGAGEEWERRKADERVPGATGEPSEDGDEDGEDDGEELDFGRALAEDGGGDADDRDDQRTIPIPLSRSTR